MTPTSGEADGIRLIRSTLLDRPGLDLLGHAGGLDLVAQLVDLGLLRVVLTQLALDGLELLAQDVLALGLVHLGLDFGLDPVLFVSGNAHLIMPWHVALDGARERRLGRLQIGTTRRAGSVPPTLTRQPESGYAVQDLLDPKILLQKLELAVAEKNVWLERVVRARASRRRGDGRDAPRIAPAWNRRTWPTRRSSWTVRCGTASGPLRGRAGNAARSRPRDVPVRHVVEPVAGGRRGGLGIGPTRIDARRRRHQGVRDARRRRARSRPRSRRARPEHVRRSGSEFGTSPAVRAAVAGSTSSALRFAVRVNGITSLALTKLDVLVRVRRDPRLRAVPARGRERDGGVPRASERLPPLPPRFETLSGWEAAIEDELPAARSYVAFVEAALEVPVTLVGRARHVMACSRSASTRVRKFGRGWRPPDRAVLGRRESRYLLVSGRPRTTECDVSGGRRHIAVLADACTRRGRARARPVR